MEIGRFEIESRCISCHKKIYTMSLKERRDVLTYPMEASNLHEYLTTLGEMISDKEFINIVLNGLPKSFKMIIEGITYLSYPTFDNIMSKILVENERITIQNQKYR